MASGLAGPSWIFLFESAKDRLKKLAVGSFTDNKRGLGQCPGFQKKHPGLFLVVMLLLFVSSSIAPAVPKGSISGYGKYAKRTHISGTISHADQNARTFKVHWIGRGSSHPPHEITGKTTEKTAYIGGSQANLVNGAHVKVAFHLEGPGSETVVADHVKFVSAKPSILQRVRNFVFQNLNDEDLYRSLASTHWFR
jgi:hypothetical protein